MITKIKDSQFTKVVAIYLALSIFFQVLYPTVAMALTGGPSQPEVQSFEPVGTSEMVDLFSGDFTYNIPLLDVGGYPINLSYHSGITMDQESSWVGLGWNINAGAITRNMRGMPDDFSGDEIKKEFNIKDNITYGSSLGFGAEIAGYEGLSINFGLGINYNNYTGISTSRNAGLSFNKGGSSPFTSSLGLSSSSDGGLSINPSLSFQGKIKKIEKADVSGSLSIGLSFNSRQGLLNLSTGYGVSQNRDVRPKKNIRKIASSGGSVNGGGSITFGNSTYVPSINMPMKNTTYTVTAKLGGTVFCGDGTASITGFCSKQVLATKEESIPAYGYIYSENSSNRTDVLLDFNREKDGSFNKNTPALPLTNFTYDVYSVSAQGVGGMYRPFRGDIPYVYDRFVANTSASGNLGLDVKLGNIAQGGADITVASVITECGQWTSSDNLSGNIGFIGKQAGSEYESCYFKQAGEKSVDDNSEVFDDLGGFSPVRFKLYERMGYTNIVDNTLMLNDAEMTKKISAANGNNIRAKRQKRNQAISYLTSNEYSDYAIDPSYYSSFSSTAKGHHIAEITTLKPDGSRYVFGLPVYNKEQKEVSFNASNRRDSQSIETGQLTYKGTDNSVGNKRGLDNYYSCVTMPAYAHSYMLTSVLSNDYIDLGINAGPDGTIGNADDFGKLGPSPDDLGTYTKFIYKTVSDYQWRVPFSENKANYNEVLKTKSNDDQANYLYGKKDVNYLKRIETKNHIAIFTHDNRKDAIGVKGENGGFSGLSKKSLLLEKISLYSRVEYEIWENDQTNQPLPVAIKEVHFVYDYSLCKDVDNNDHSPLNSSINEEYEADSNQGGKLTLKKVYFTYLNSNKGRYNQYKFDYDNLNPNYHLKGYDRWGNYKPENDGNLYSSEYPYVSQNKVLTDGYSSAWTMTGIKLPSGGKINIDYESDDYAYVQDKKAMQMMCLSGVSTDLSNPTGNVLEKDVAPYLFFEIDVAYSDVDLRSKYFDFTDEIYFRILAKVNKSSQNNGYEYVSGYARIDKTNIGSILDSGTGKHYAYCKVLENSNIDLENPIAQAAVQFGRLHTPQLAYGIPPTSDNGVNENQVLQFVKKMVESSFARTILEAASGPNNYLYNKGIGNTIIPSKSWVRLSVPNKKKLGGGVRVKSVKLIDNWKDMDSGSLSENSFTGQEYTYTTIENGNEISSGVAQYEPMIGADENPFRSPVEFGSEEDFLASLTAPDDRFYQEKPYGESFFPAASVGYSKVKVKSIQQDPTQTITRHATGWVENEFFTAKDYPIISHRTNIDIKENKTSKLLSSILKIDIKDYVTASQGFSIEMNDMHGKEKAQWVYAENSVSPISGVEYFYKDNGTVTNGKRLRGNHLSNSISVIEKDGTVNEKQVGVDYDFVVDMREHYTKATNIGVQANLYGFLAGIIPIVVPPIWGSYSSQKTRFRSVVATKVINRYALLDETVAYDLGSKVSVKNLALDGETGEVLLTQTTNEFNDEIFSLSYPVHWVYDEMGMAYQNLKFECLASHSSPGEFIVTTPVAAVFVEGDVIKLTDLDASTTEKCWVTNIASNTLTLIGEDGNPPTTTSGNNYKLKIIQSGRKNMQNISVGAITSSINPLSGNKVDNYSSSDNILAANAMEYSNVWGGLTACGDVSANPFKNGSKGIWRSFRSYLYLAERIQNPSTNNSDIREDGAYASFSSFWVVPLNSTSPWTKNSSNWTWASQVTKYNPYGFEVENQDPLDRYSSALFGYNNKLPIAVSSNAEYREIAFDSFEDYLLNSTSCNPAHFRFSIKDPTVNELSNTESHTGRYSMKVKAGKTLRLQKDVQ